MSWTPPHGRGPNGCAGRPEYFAPPFLYRSATLPTFRRMPARCTHPVAHPFGLALLPIQAAAAGRPLLSSLLSPTPPQPHACALTCQPLLPCIPPPDAPTAAPGQPLGPGHGLATGLVPLPLVALGKPKGRGRKDWDGKAGVRMERAAAAAAGEGGKAAGEGGKAAAGGSAAGAAATTSQRLFPRAIPSVQQVGRVQQVWGLWVSR